MNGHFRRRGAPTLTTVQQIRELRRLRSERKKFETAQRAEGNGPNKELIERGLKNIDSQITRLTTMHGEVY